MGTIPNNLKSTEEIGNKKKNRDHRDYSSIKISLDTLKSPGDLRRLAVTQTPVKSYLFNV